MLVLLMPPSMEAWVRGKTDWFLPLWYHLTFERLREKDIRSGGKVVVRISDSDTGRKNRGFLSIDSQSQEWQAQEGPNEWPLGPSLWKNLKAFWLGEDQVGGLGVQCGRVRIASGFHRIKAYFTTY